MNAEMLRRLRARLWEDDDTRSPDHAQAVALGRYLFALGRDLAAGDLSMRAMSLVYTTLLSIVPLLALAFSVLKALGVHNSLEPVLEEFLRPLGSQAEVVSQQVIGFVEHIEVGVLGSLGIALLFYTAISLIQKIEASFNFIWRIERPRPVTQRIGEYLGVLMVGPVLVFSALGITATVLNSSIVLRIAQVEPLGGLIYGSTKLIPYVLIVAVFSFMYRFMPNTQVRFRAAITGGVTAGLLWQSSSLAFASFVARSSNYNAIYSGFAILIFLLIWLYVGWLVLLIGCQLAFYVQNPRHLRPRLSAAQLGGRQAEVLALLVMALAGRRYIAGEPGYTEEELLQELDAAPEEIDLAVETLIDRRYLIESGRTRTVLIPARDLDSVTVGQLWRDVREGGSGLRMRHPVGREVIRLLEDAERRFTESAGGLTLREWVAPPG